jgi:two-component system, NarL family, response regulator NreC
MPRKKRRTISVLLADDHAILLDGLRALLEAEGDLKVVGSAINGEEAVRLARQLRPDIAIVDIKMPVMDGIEATRRIRESSPSTRILILSAHVSAHYVDQALSAGAEGYVLKESEGPELIKAVRAIIDGKRYLSASLAGNMVQDPLASLTVREREVLQLVVDGKSNAAAASILGLSPRSVETYRLRVMQKLGIEDLPTLVKFAIRHGMTTLE